MATPSPQPGEKRKRVVKIRSLQTKLSAIADVEAGTGTKGEVARRYNVPPNTLSTWIKNADKIKAASMAADFQPSRKKLRTTPYGDVDKALHGWYVSAKAMGVTFTSKQLQTRAEQLAGEMGYEGFKCSNGWMSRFKQRYNFDTTGSSSVGSGNRSGGDASDTTVDETDMANIDPMYFDTIGEFDPEEEEDDMMFGGGGGGSVMPRVRADDGRPEVDIDDEEDEGDRAMRAFRDDGRQAIMAGHPLGVMNRLSVDVQDQEEDPFDDEPCSIIDIVKSEQLDSASSSTGPDSPPPPTLEPVEGYAEISTITERYSSRPPSMTPSVTSSVTSGITSSMTSMTPISALRRVDRPGPRCSKLRAGSSGSSSPGSVSTQGSRSRSLTPHRTASPGVNHSHSTKTPESGSRRTKTTYDKLKIAIIGQSQFGAEVYKLLKHDQHKIVGVFTIPDKDGRADPLAQVAEADGVSVFKFPRWRTKGQPLPEVLEKYKEVGAELNVMPFCSQFIPMEVIQHPKHESIIYHPSILPLHRGASAINWTLMQGDPKAGFTIFWADDGLDTGPILLQRECKVEPNDTVDAVYNRFLYPEGIKAMAEAVQLIGDGKAPRIVQSEEGATYDPIMKKDKAGLDWKMGGHDIHNWIRGNDKVPGAWTTIDGQKVTLYGSRVLTGAVPKGTDVAIEGMSRPAVVYDDGMAFFGSDGVGVSVAQLQFEDGKMIKAAKYGQAEESLDVEFTAEEQGMVDAVKEMWVGILGNPDINDDTDFFKAGAGSMEVVRLVEEVKDKTGVTLTNEDVYMATTLGDFTKTVVLFSRGGGGKKEFTYEAVEMEVNNMTIRFPNQLFINNEFCDASDGKTFESINPATEEVICKVAKGSKDDVDRAVACAKAAFEGTWGQMNPRDRGTIMYKLADLMDEHKEELATLESIDSGAVYTLALKTHIGMSTDTFRYMAGWCDKIHGTTIPINQARPNRNLTYTKREPIGVCGIITPWNYPLMMLAWKMSACLAAGNTVVLKPAQVTPLTSLKFGELAVKAGFPPGVINILSGSGSIVGQGIADHPDVRKLGFTGSTQIGKVIMESCAKSNLKKVSLELGGKSPLIIFDDCDMDRAVRFGMSSVFFNKGENCIAAGRLFVEESIHDQYVERILAEIKKMKIGSPLDRSTDHGPQNHKAHLDSLVDYCKRGVEEGATLVAGGKQVECPGLFLYPTVFTDVDDNMFIAKEESFGPIMVISKFNANDIDDVIRRANATEFGLASGVFTKDISRALYVADKIQAGTCFINTYNKTDVAAPFGGFKQSGFGKDLGEEALNEYLKTKCVTVEY